MTDQQHPITPPPELVQQWREVWEQSGNEVSASLSEYVAIQAARWGADQQLEQDAKWLDTNALFSRNLTISPSGDALRQEMRPKPPSLKEQALSALYAIATGADDTREFYQDIETIKTALEQLDD